LTVLDDCVHVNLVGGGKSDLVSLPVFVSTRLFKDDFDLGLFISFDHVVRGRGAYLGLSSTGKRGGGVHGGTVHQYLIICGEYQVDPLSWREKRKEKEGKGKGESGKESSGKAEGRT
jgi:hypothetical protein